MYMQVGYLDCSDLNKAEDVFVLRIIIIIIKMMDNETYLLIQEGPKEVNSGLCIF